MPLTSRQKVGNIEILVNYLFEINKIYYRNSSEKVGIPAEVGKMASLLLIVLSTASARM